MNNHVFFCIKCEKTYLNSSHCPFCQKPLLIFSKESATLSKPDTFLTYDQHHPYNPLGDYQGKYQHFSTPFIEQSILECEDILKRHPHHVEALHHLGLIYKRENAFSKALGYFEKILSLLPEHIDALKNASYLYQKIKEYKKGILCLKKLRKLEPKQPLHLENMATLYFYLQHPLMAVRYLIQAYHLYENVEKKAELKKQLHQLSQQANSFDKSP